MGASVDQIKHALNRGRARAIIQLVLKWRSVDPSVELLVQLLTTCRLAVLDGESIIAAIRADAVLAAAMSEHRELKSILNEDLSTLADLVSALIVHELETSRHPLG